jgi:hypothetical protein
VLIDGLLDTLVKIGWQRHYHNVYRFGFSLTDISVVEDALGKGKLFFGVVV